MGWGRSKGLKPPRSPVPPLNVFDLSLARSLPLSFSPPPFLINFRNICSSLSWDLLVTSTINRCGWEAFDPSQTDMRRPSLDALPEPELGNDDEDRFPSQDYTSI